jgi:hypothetical protein
MGAFYTKRTCCWLTSLRQIIFYRHYAYLFHP